MSTWRWVNGEPLEEQITNNSSKPVTHMHLEIKILYSQTQI